MGVVVVVFGVLAQPLMLSLGCSPDIRIVEYAGAGALAAGLILLGIVDRLVRAVTMPSRGLPGGYSLAAILAVLVAAAAVYVGARVSQRSEAQSDSRSAAVVKDFADSLAQAGVQSREEYLGEMDGIGWNTVLSAERLAQDEDLTATEKILVEAEKLVSKYAKKAEDNFEQIPVLAGRLDLPGDVKQQLISEWEVGAEATREKIKRVWELERQVLEHFRAIARLLARRESWVIENGQLQFRQQADLDEFKSIMNKIQSSAAEQQQIQAEFGIIPTSN